MRKLLAEMKRRLKRAQKAQALATDRWAASAATTGRLRREMDDREACVAALDRAIGAIEKKLAEREAA